MKSLMLTRGVALVGALTLLHAPVALATGGNSFENKPLHLTSGAGGLAHTSSAGAGGSIMRTIIGLAIVIALIYGLTYVMRRIKGAGAGASGTGLEQVATLPLGTNRSVALVRVGSELHLLGIAEHSVTTIRTYTEDEAIEAGLSLGDDALAGAASGPGVGFAAAGQPLTRAIDALRRMTVR